MPPKRSKAVRETAQRSALRQRVTDVITGALCFEPYPAEVLQRPKVIAFVLGVAFDIKVSWQDTGSVNAATDWLWEQGVRP